MTGSLFWTVRRKIEFLEKRMNKMNSKTKQKKNQGFSLITVILAVSFIGIITFSLSIVGVKAGNVFGIRYKSRAELAGGTILLLIGSKILIEHLFL